MATKQRIRKVAHASTVDFDEQQWPINVALVILGAFVAGIVLATSDFDDPRILYNGWVRLLGVALTMGLLFGGVAYLQRKVMRRVQLCVLVSLLFHLWLALYLHQHFLRLLAQEEMRQARQEEVVYDPVTIPDYHPEQIEQLETRQAFEEPVPTQEPVEADPQPLEPQDMERPLPTRDKPEVEPEEAERQRPSPAEIQRAELSAPRRAELAAGGQVSRQEWQQRPVPDEPIPQPEIRPPGEQPTRPLVDQVASLERRRTDAPRQERQTLEEPAAEHSMEVAQLARSARESEPAPEHPTTPAPTRQLTDPAEVAQTEASAPEPVRAVEQPHPAELTPATELAERHSDPTRPIAGKQATEPAPAPVTEPAQAATEHRRMDLRPELAQAPHPRPTRHVQRAEVPAEPAVEQPHEAIAGSTQAAESSLQPTEPTVSRQEVAQAAPTRDPATLEELPSAAAPSPVAESRPRRASPAAPTPQPEQQPVAPPPMARQVRAADSPTPSEVSAPSVAQTPAPPSTDADAPEATSIAIERAPAAPAHSMAATEAAGQPLPALSARAQLPSALARRAEPSQPQPAADTPSTPAEPSTLARNLQGAQLPSTAIRVESEVAAAPGSAAPSEVEATSPAAAVARSAAGAPESTAVAAAGAADFAVGAGQVAARTGQPRAADTGQPALAESSPVPRPARATSGLAASAMPTPEIAAEPSTAAEADGPSAPAMAAADVAVQRSGQASLPDSPLSPGAGSAADTGASTPVDAAQLSRVTRYESTPEGTAGGDRPTLARGTVGREMAAEIEAEPAPTDLAAAAGAEQQQGSPLEANVQGEQRQIAGLPGSQPSAPMAGAVESTTDHGAAMPDAMARRAPASQTSDDAPGLRPDVTATLARAPSGVDLPAAAAPADEAPTTGPGGVAAAEGAAPSTLEPGDVATVQRTAAAEASAGDRPVAAGSAEFSVGDAQVVALTGQLAPGAESLPTPATAGEPSPLGRTTAAATIPTVDIDGAAPQAVAAAPADTAVGEAGEPGASAAPTEIARAAGSGLPTGSPADAGAPAPAGPPSDVDAPELARRGSREVILASAAGAAVGSPQRTPGRLPVAETLADMPAAAPLATVAGDPNPPVGGASQAAEVGPQRRTPGLPGPPSDRPPVAELATEPGPAATTPGTTAGQRRLPDGSEEGPVLAANVGGAPLRKRSAAGLPRGLAEAEAPEPVAATEGTETGRAAELTEGALAGKPSRREGGLPVQLAALPGPGGLSSDPSPEVGIPSRRASRDSEVVHDVSRRFALERSGGELAIDGTVYEPTEGFQHRGGRRAQLAQARGGSEGTERAVEMGLDFLARIQFPDGRWSLHELPPGVDLPEPALGVMQADTAATGLALLTYLGAGYTHLDDKHRTVVDKGLAWLVGNQEPNGDLFTRVGGSRPVWFYSHGIAAMALCEAYGMTQDPELREPAQLAVQFICETQHPTRGGWRYDVDSQGRSRESDTSVSGWLLMALKSAEMAGLEVPSEVVANVNDWLDLAKAGDAEGQYVYNPFAGDVPEQQAGRHPNLAMTAEGMLMRIYLGRRRDNARLIAGADFLRRNPPEVGTAEQRLRDSYYWYYATQAMFQMQEPYWTEWNDRLRPILEVGQEQTGPQAGSWHPMRPVPDRWGHAGGRLYVTAMHLLMLEGYYRHLPLFEELSR